MFVTHKGGNGAHLVHPLPRFHPLQHIHDVLVVAGSHDGFGLGDRLQQLLLEMLGQASRDDQFLALFRQSHQGAHRFLAGVLDEAAGVHHHNGGIPFIGADAVARFRQQPHHVFGVHPILLAAQVGEGDRRFRRGAGHHVAGRPKISLRSGLITPELTESDHLKFKDGHHPSRQPSPSGFRR